MLGVGISARIGANVGAFEGEGDSVSSLVVLVSRDAVV